jgi:hypothetical protein
MEREDTDLFIKSLDALHLSDIDKSRFTLVRATKYSPSSSLSEETIVIMANLFKYILDSCNNLKENEVVISADYDSNVFMAFTKGIVVFLNSVTHDLLICGLDKILHSFEKEYKKGCNMVIEYLNGA